MLFRLTPFVSSLLFISLILFTLFRFSDPNFWLIISLGILLILFFIKKSAGKISESFIPLLLVIGSLPVLSLMETALMRYVVIGILALLFYFELLVRERIRDFPKDELATPLLTTTNFIVFFIWANLIFASFINFSEKIFPFWAMLLISALISFLVSRDILKHTFFKRKEAGIMEINLVSSLIALLTSQITWTLAFYPLRYRSSAVILLSAFYLAFVSGSAFLNKDEKRGKLAKDIVIAIIAVVIVLVTSKWRYY